MADNFTLKYASGAEVTLRATELGSIAGGDQRYIPHVVIDDGTGEGISDSNPLPVKSIDANEREGLNTVFGESISAVRKADIAAQFQYGFPASSASQETANGGSISIVESMLTLSTSTNTAGSAAISNRKALRYLPGQEAFFYFTAIFTSPKANSLQRSGLFDSGNGFFVGYEGTVFCVTRRRDSVDENHEVDLSSIYDADDGVFDPTKGNVYRISFGYLGFAAINFEVMNPRGGWNILHKIEYPNSSTETHILNTNLQPRGEVANSGNDTNITIKVGSFSAGVVNGGGSDPAKRRFSFSATDQTRTAGTLMVVTFRSKSIFGGLTNYIQSSLTLLSYNTDLTKSSLWDLEKNATISTAGGAPTWAPVNLLDSTIEYSVDAVVSRGTGEVVLPIPLGKVDRELITDLEAQEIDLLPGDYITLFIVSPGGTSGTYDFSYRWKELF